MNKDQVKGKLKDIKGRTQRQVSEWTGDEKGQAEGAVEQVKGKAQKAWGDLKDEGNDALRDVERPRREDDVEQNEARPRKRRAA